MSLLPDELRVGPPPLRERSFRRMVSHAKRMVSDMLVDAVLRLEIVFRRCRSAGQDGHDQCRILVIDDLVPDPLFGFGFPRMFEIVRSLARMGHQVTMYPITSAPHELERMNDLCNGLVRFMPGKGARGLRRLMAGWPGYDLVLVSRPDPMNAYCRAAHLADNKPLVTYDMEAVTTPREAARRRLFGEPWSSEQGAEVLRREIDIVTGANAFVAVTEIDRALVANRFDMPSFVVSFPTKFAPSTNGFAERADLLFVGRMTGTANHYPNVDAVGWFAREVMPCLDRLIGSRYRLHLVGLFEEEAAALASDRVILHGAINDVSGFYDECRLFVAPTRYAAGIPIKVVETIGRGLPAVTTPLLAEQIGGEGHGFTAEISPEAFAATCARLYTDEDAWRAAREYGLALAQQRFSQTGFDDVLRRLTERAMTRFDSKAI